MSYLILDIETLAHECAVDYVPKPDLDAIKAAGNLKDPEKIAADIEKRKAEATAEYERSLSRAALDWNVNRIVAIGWHKNGEPEPQCVLTKTESEEAEALETFWKMAGRGHASVDGKLVGFCIRSFDLPVLIQRSLLWDVKPRTINLAPFGRSGDLIDLFDELTFHGHRGTTVMPQTLKAFAKRFGIEHLDPTTGKDVAQMVADGDWEGVRSHCLSDIDLTRRLALRTHKLPFWKEAAA